MVAGSADAERAKALAHVIEGSGLGLSLVARNVEQHGARLSLHDGPGGRGLAVEVALPLALSRP